MLLTFYYEHTLCERDFTCALFGFQIFFQEKFVKEFQESLPTDLKNLEKVLEGNEGGKGYFVGKKVCTHLDCIFLRLFAPSFCHSFTFSGTSGSSVT